MANIGITFQRVFLLPLKGLFLNIWKILKSLIKVTMRIKQKLLMCWKFARDFSLKKKKLWRILRTEVLKILPGKKLNLVFVEEYFFQEKG